LNPQGLFVFDVVTARGMRMLAGTVLHIEVKGQRFAYEFHYDRETRREEVAVMFPTAVELHERISIEASDVLTAAAKSGLKVRDYFAGLLLPGSWSSGAICYFTLQQPG
jgi:hypothetical protein